MDLTVGFGWAHDRYIAGGAELNFGDGLSLEAKSGNAMDGTGGHLDVMDRSSTTCTGGDVTIAGVAEPTYPATIMAELERGPERAASKLEQQYDDQLQQQQQLQQCQEWEHVTWNISPKLREYGHM